MRVERRRSVWEDRVWVRRGRDMEGRGTRLLSRWRAWKSRRRRFSSRLWRSRKERESWRCREEQPPWSRKRWRGLAACWLWRLWNDISASGFWRTHPALDCKSSRNDSLWDQRRVIHNRLEFSVTEALVEKRKKKKTRMTLRKSGRGGVLQQQWIEEWW